MSKFKPIVTLFVILIVGYFFGQNLSTNWDRVKEIGFVFNLYSLLAISLFALAVITTGFLWGKLVTQVQPNQEFSSFDFIKVHITSWLLKYLPGQVGSALGKINWARENKLSKLAISFTFFYENFFLFFSSLLVSIPILLTFALDEVLGAKSSLLTLLFIFPFIFVFHKPTFNKIIIFIIRFFPRLKYESSYLIGNLTIIKYLLLFTIPRIINALGFIAIAFALYQPNFNQLPLLAAAYIFAGLIGLLTFLVPSGIGVREGVIVLLLAPTLGSTEAVVISIYARLMTSLADLILVIINYLPIKFLRKQ